MATVDVVCPSYNGWQRETTQSMSAMVAATQCQCGTHEPWECDAGYHSVRIVPAPEGLSIIHWARNRALMVALYGLKPTPDGRPPAEFIFLMDDDMVCHQEYLRRLLSHNADIVSGIATVRSDPPKPNIRNWNAEKREWNVLENWDFDSKKPFEVDAVGCAFMLVKRMVFAKMGAAWLNCTFERMEDKRKYPRCDEIDAYWDKRSNQRNLRFMYGQGKDWTETNCWWFQCLDDDRMGRSGEMGEDMSFCWKARKLGFKVLVDPQVLPGHIGKYGYSVADHREFVEARQAAGETIPVWDGKVGIHAGMDTSATSGGSKQAHGAPR